MKIWQSYNTYCPRCQNTQGKKQARDIQLGIDSYLRKRIRAIENILQKKCKFYIKNCVKSIEKSVS